MIPGEMRVAAGDIELNAGRATVTLAVTSSGDRPAQVGSHFHIFETNEVRADGELLVCEPETVLPMAQRYFLF